MFFKFNITRGYNFFTNQSYINDKEKLCFIMFHLFSFKLGFCSKFTVLQQNHHQLQDAIDDDSCS